MNATDANQLSGPPVLLFSEPGTERNRWLSAIEAVGASALAVAPVSALAARLAETASSRVLALVLDKEDDAEVASAIALGERFADKVGGRLVVSAPLETVDSAVDAAHDATQILCRPEFADCLGALALALNRPVAPVNDNAGLDGMRLKRLADEVNRIARALSNLSDAEPEPGPRYEAGVADVQLDFRAAPSARAFSIMPADIRAMLRLRRLRDRFFPGDLFADPAWDMLLDLFAARMEGDNVAVSSLCIAAAVPPTTALRWIKTMTDERLFERHADPMDGRRIFIRLSDRAMDAMERYFAAADGHGRMI